MTEGGNDSQRARGISREEDGKLREIFVIQEVLRKGVLEVMLQGALRVQDFSEKKNAEQSQKEYEELVHNLCALWNLYSPRAGDMQAIEKFLRNAGLLRAVNVHGGELMVVLRPKTYSEFLRDCRIDEPSKAVQKEMRAFADFSMRRVIKVPQDRFVKGRKEGKKEMPKIRGDFFHEEPVRGDIVPLVDVLFSSGQREREEHMKECIEIFGYETVRQIFIFAHELNQLHAKRESDQLSREQREEEGIFKRVIRRFSMKYLEEDENAYGDIADRAKTLLETEFCTYYPVACERLLEITGLSRSIPISISHDSEKIVLHTPRSLKTFRLQRPLTHQQSAYIEMFSQHTSSDFSQKKRDNICRDLEHRVLAAELRSAFREATKNAKNNFSALSVDVFYKAWERYMLLLCDDSDAWYALHSREQPTNIQEVKALFRDTEDFGAKISALQFRN